MLYNIYIKNILYLCSVNKEIEKKVKPAFRKAESTKDENYEKE